MEHDVRKRDRKDEFIRGVLRRAVKRSEELELDVNEIFTIDVSRQALHHLTRQARTDLLRDLDDAAMNHTNLRVHSTSANNTIIHLYVAQRH